MVAVNPRGGYQRSVVALRIAVENPDREPATLAPGPPHPRRISSHGPWLGAHLSRMKPDPPQMRRCGGSVTPHVSRMWPDLRQIRPYLGQVRPDLLRMRRDLPGLRPELAQMKRAPGVANPIIGKELCRRGGWWPPWAVRSPRHTLGGR